MDKTKRYNISFKYDGIAVNIDCHDYWWDNYGKTLVIISNVTSFYESSRISDLHVVNFERENKW